MTADRTRHVLDAIDGALEDWSVSGDAMRWSASGSEIVSVEVIKGRAPRAHAVLSDVRLAPLGTAIPGAHLARFAAAVAEFGTAIRAACEAEAERLHRMLNPTPEALDLRAQILRAFDLTPVEAGFEPDPKARALHLRRTRNTGPERKPAGQSKRPRSL